MRPTVALAKPLPAFTDPAEPAARPKVMRRPSHFSSNAPAPSLLEDRADHSPNLAELPALPVAVAAPPLKAWQDDIRFGMVMVTLVTLANLALMLWLPHIQHLPTAKNAAPIPHASMAATVQPDNAITPPVTLYTKSAPEPVAEPTLEDSAGEMLAADPKVHILGGM